MAHTPEYLHLTVSWNHPGLAEALETIIAKAWAEGFRAGVNAERAGDGPFGAEALADRYRDWRGYGPGVLYPGGTSASTRIRAEDRAAGLSIEDEVQRVRQPSETRAARELQEKLNRFAPGVFDVSG